MTDFEDLPPTVIAPSARIDFTAIIRKGATIGPDVVVHRFAEVGKGATIGAGAIICAGAIVRQFAVVNPGAIIRPWTMAE